MTGKAWSTDMKLSRRDQGHGATKCQLTATQAKARHGTHLRNALCGRNSHLILVLFRLFISPLRHLRLNILQPWAKACIECLLFPLCQPLFYSREGRMGGTNIVCHCIPTKHIFRLFFIIIGHIPLSVIIRRNKETIEIRRRCWWPLVLGSAFLVLRP